MLSANPFIIDTEVNFNQTRNQIFMTFIHADSDECQRNQNWEELRTRARYKIGMWVTLGDFNATLTITRRKDARGRHKDRLTTLTS